MNLEGIQDSYGRSWLLPFPPVPSVPILTPPAKGKENRAWSRTNAVDWMSTDLRLSVAPSVVARYSVPSVSTRVFKESAGQKLLVACLRGSQADSGAACLLTGAFQHDVPHTWQSFPGITQVSLPFPWQVGQRTPGIFGEVNTKSARCSAPQGIGDQDTYRHCDNGEDEMRRKNAKERKN